MEGKIKFIKGVEGRGAEVRKLIKEMGAQDDFCFSEANYCKPQLIFYVDCKTVQCLDYNSHMAALLMKHGEEIFLEPEYKFNVGDKVIPKNALPSETYHTVIARINDHGKPWYDLERNGVLSGLSEEDIKPYVERRVKTWDDLRGDYLEGYYISDLSAIQSTRTAIANNTYKNVATSEKVCKVMLAMAQISQLMPHYGGEVTTEEWNDTSITKYTINREGNRIADYRALEIYNFLAFHTEEQRDEFLSYPENEKLVRDFLMLSDDNDE